MRQLQSLQLGIPSRDSNRKTVHCKRMSPSPPAPSAGPALLSAVAEICTDAKTLGWELHAWQRGDGGAVPLVSVELDAQSLSPEQVWRLLVHISLFNMVFSCDGHLTPLSGQPPCGWHTSMRLHRRIAAALQGLFCAVKQCLKRLMAWFGNA